MYIAFFFKRQTRWNPTSRSLAGDGPVSDPASEMDSLGSRANVYQAFLNGFAFEMRPTLPGRLEDSAISSNRNGDLDLRPAVTDASPRHAVASPSIT
jgi:hypothetical protein